MQTGLFLSISIVTDFSCTAPSPVPFDWNGGFVAVDGVSVFYSSSGASWDLVDSIDYSVYEPWSVSFSETNTQWMIKLAQKGSSDGGYKIFSTTSNDGVNWTTPRDSGLKSYYDPSLAVCNNNVSHSNLSFSL